MNAQAYLGCEPVLTVDSVAVPDCFPGEPVQALVEGCLRMNPDERLSANEALANPFFSVQSLITGKQVLETEQKIGLLRRQAKLLRPSRAQFALHVRRATLIGDTIEVRFVCLLALFPMITHSCRRDYKYLSHASNPPHKQAFNSMDNATLMHPFHVHFIGEPAIGSGLLSDFYESFFSCLARCVHGTHCFTFFPSNQYLTTTLFAGTKCLRAGCRTRAARISTLSGWSGFSLENVLSIVVLLALARPVYSSSS